MVFVRGYGCYVEDNNGHKYIDFQLGHGPVILGHSNIQFQNELMTYLSNGFHFPAYSIYHEQLSFLFQTDRYSRINFYKTSSEAVSAAVRLAAFHNKRKKIIRCGYIGWHDALLGNSINWHEQVDSPFRNSIQYPVGFRGISDDEKVYNWSSFDLTELELLLKSEEISSMVYDAYQLHFSSKEDLLKVMLLCKKYGTVFILDETKTAGRCARRGISELYDLSPDLIVYGKAIANGAPLSLLSGIEEIMSHTKEARVRGTFSKECLGVYCALICADILEKNGGYTRLSTIAKTLAMTFNQAFASEHIDHLVRCVPVFESAILNFQYSIPLLGDIECRNKLQDCFAFQKILLSDGHPFFASLAHEELNLDLLYHKSRKAIQQWVNYSASFLN